MTSGAPSDHFGPRSRSIHYYGHGNNSAEAAPIGLTFVPAGRQNRPDANHRGRRRLFAADWYARTTLVKIAAAAECRRKPCRVRGKGRAHDRAVEYVSVGGGGARECAQSRPRPPIARRFPTVGTALDIVVDEQTAAHERSARLAQALIGAAAVDLSSIDTSPI